MRRVNFFLFYFLVNTFCICSQQFNFAESPKYKHASVSIAVIDCSTGGLRMSLNPHLSVTPASVLKVVTTATAWQTMAPDHRFKTVLCAGSPPVNGIIKGNLVIKGYGDPTLGSEYFPTPVPFLDDWVQAVKKAGIHTIEGDVIADISAWYDEPLPTRWIWEDIGNYYGAGAWPLSCFDNKYTVVFHPAKVGARARIASVKPDIQGLTFRVEARGAANNIDSAYIFGDPDNYAKTIRGTIPANRMDFSIKGAIPNPPNTLAMLFRKRLMQNGITCVGKHGTSSTSTGSEYNIATFVSPPLQEIITVTNMKSVNHFAEHLLRTMGTTLPTNSPGASAQKMREYWKNKGVDPAAAFFFDGSGLSPSNKVSAYYIAAVLRFSADDSFIKTLPKAGSEGTVRNMLKNITKAEVRLKSGSMDAVRCYAGYIIKDGKKFAIAIMINNFTGESKAVVSDVEKYIGGVVSEL
jgi:serine-type D-Ala-D-Ala carboxypeptidase/endopeptidase (penicillin-binding protein 4)